MKILIQKTTNSDGAAKHRLVIDGKSDIYITPLYECPEDATLERDMINGDELAAYIQMGYDAAKRGEELEITEQEVEEFDY